VGNPAADHLAELDRQELARFTLEAAEVDEENAGLAGTQGGDDDLTALTQRLHLASGDADRRPIEALEEIGCDAVDERDRDRFALVVPDDCVSHPSPR